MKIQPFFIRSTIFNLCFYFLTAIICLTLLPTLFFPRKVLLAVVKIFAHNTAFLEKYILGLTYEVRGKEHLPKEGSYIVAAKHQSAYETFKLHILFDDPAIVLKKELLKIPLWGKYLEKSDVIAIDRSTPKIAIKSVKDGAKRIAKQGRAIVIFPQGTRVCPETTTQNRPYKIGVVRMQEATGLPIIPMALNTGLFHPKNTWCQKPGHVIFEFLPPIAPSDDASSVLNRIEMAVEEKTSKLIEEGKKSIPRKSKYSKALGIAALLLFAIYTINWFIAADIAKKAVMDSINELQQNPNITNHKISEPKIHGFPWKLKLSMGKQLIETSYGNMSIKSINAQSWPVMGMPIDIKIKEIALSSKHWKSSLVFDAMDSQLVFKNNVMTLAYARLVKNQAQVTLSGDVKFDAPYPEIDLIVKLINVTPMIENMVQNKMLPRQIAMFALAALKSLEKDGVVSSTLTSDKNKLYLGPIKIIEL